MDLKAVAEYLGITADSARTYHGRAQHNRRNGTPRPGDLPEPDLIVAGRPAWTKETITTWAHNRPGKGVGGGRPPVSRPKP